MSPDRNVFDALAVQPASMTFQVYPLLTLNVKIFGFSKVALPESGTYIYIYIHEHIYVHNIV